MAFGKKTKKSNPAPTEGGSAKKRKFRPSRRLIAAIVLTLAVVIAVIIGVNQYRKWRNDGERYAQNLSEQIGVSPKTAEKYAKLKLSDASAFPYINMVMEQKGYSYVYESSETVSVSGVAIPEWVVLITVDNATVSEVVYYDYKELGKYGNGTRTKDHVSATGIVSGMDSALVQEYTGFAPLCTRYEKDVTTEYYKYYYTDQNTGNVVCYVLTVEYAEGAVPVATETQNHFLLSMLTVG